MKLAQRSQRASCSSNALVAGRADLPVQRVGRISAAGVLGTSAAQAPRSHCQHPLIGQRSAVCSAAAPAVEPAASSPQTQEWYALVASAEFFFNDAQNESLAEQLRERVRFFKEQGKERDFHFVPEPKWLDAKYPEQAKKVKRPCVALVSTDKNWIVFMKLRLDRVVRIDLGSAEQAEVLAVGGTVPEMKGPEKWTAPYPRYAPGWWNVFVPGQ